MFNQFIPTFTFSKSGNVTQMKLRKYSHLKNLRSSYFLTVFSLMTSIIFLPFVSYSQEVDYYDKGYIYNDDVIYKENINTVLLYRMGNELSPPLIILNSGEQLFFSFDDFEQVVKKYYFTVVHCDAYWNTSEIQKMEYINGFEYDEVDDYHYSYNTTQKYINYRGVFPTDYIKVYKSGNYILRVYENEDRDENVIFTRRFMVVNPKVFVEGIVDKTTNLDDRYTKQQVDFKIIADNISIQEPFRELHVVVRQNNRWDNAVFHQQPRMVVGNQYDYSLNDKLAFNGGNEFRYLDMKTLRYNTDRMQSLVYLDNGYNVFIFPDKNSRYKDYLSEDDINGRRLIATNQARDSYTEGDYAWVHFFLPYNSPEAGGSFYIFGELSNWQFRPDNLMKYDYEAGGYEGSLYLKQGYYNYAYAFLPNGLNIADVSLTEGSHWETENEYQVLVYWRQPGEFYDQLVAAFFLNSVGP
jgi:hypothetical protein